jgi:hypothetical protein
MLNLCWGLKKPRVQEVIAGYGDMGVWLADQKCGFSDGNEHVVDERRFQGPGCDDRTYNVQCCSILIAEIVHQIRVSNCYVRPGVDPLHGGKPLVN